MHCSGILGMLAGATLFEEAYPGLKKTVLTRGDLGAITVPQVLGSNHSLVYYSHLFHWRVGSVSMV